MSNSRLLPHFKRTSPSPWQFIPLFPRAWQSLIYFLSLWICLLWIFHKNGIIQYRCFVTGFFQLICKVYLLWRNVLLFNFFLWLNNVPSYGHTYLFICSLVDGHLGCFHFFWLLWLMLLWTFMYNEPRHCTFRGQGPNLALDCLLVQTGDSWEVPCLWPLGKLYAVKFSQGGLDVYLSHGSRISQWTWHLLLILYYRITWIWHFFCYHKRSFIEQISIESLLCAWLRTGDVAPTNEHDCLMEVAIQWGAGIDWSVTNGKKHVRSRGYRENGHWGVLPGEWP